MWLRLAPALLIGFVECALGLFPGAVPDEGDYRHLYPVVCVAIRMHTDYSHTFPYIFGQLEGLRYPKDRLRLTFYIDERHEDDEGRDPSPSQPSIATELIERWMRSVSGFYKSTALVTLERGENWHDSGMKVGRRYSCSHLLLTNSNALLTENSLKQLIDLNEIVVGPLLNGPFGHDSNVDGLMREEFIERKQVGSYRVYYTREPMLINLKHKDASYLTFDQDNLVDYHGSGHPIDVLAHSAYAMGIVIVVDNTHFYGHFLSMRQLTPSRHRETLSAFLANTISDHGAMSLHPVSAVAGIESASTHPVASNFGFDEIYLINLRRRPERLRKMDEIFKLLGVAYRRFEAVDGQSDADLERYEGLQLLPGYADPYHKRPMKRGEIGCFLSHYEVWHDMVRNGHDRVIVFEDDLRFTENATRILRGAVEDIMKTQLEWDMIYLGRKKMSAPGEEFFVTGHRYLSTIGYSYWTLGYALSRNGAEKLIRAKPLEKLLALDEFLPIMYGKHPNAEWARQFGPRDLKAFATYPVIVEPERYTFDVDYISDTEGSQVATGAGVNATTSTTDGRFRLRGDVVKEGMAQDVQVDSHEEL